MIELIMIEKLIDRLTIYMFSCSATQTKIIVIYLRYSVIDYGDLTSK